MSTAQLLRYMSPISFSTLNAGRQGEKKAPILQSEGDDKDLYKLLECFYIARAADTDPSQKQAIINRLQI